MEREQKKYERKEYKFDPLEVGIERCKVDTTNWELNTIFIGGGTPSLIESKYMELIINALHKKHNLNSLVYLFILFKHKTEFFLFKNDKIMRE